MNTNESEDLWVSIRDVKKRSSEIKVYLPLTITSLVSLSAEQALGMLFWHKYNVERAMIDLANFTPYPDDWSVEDKVLFEQAFSFHGKVFHRIR